LEQKEAAPMATPPCWLQDERALRALHRRPRPRRDLCRERVVPDARAGRREGLRSGPDDIRDHDLTSGERPATPATTAFTGRGCLRFFQRSL
jgi:hypothetical protein